jgi:hypothetical protein
MHATDILAYTYESELYCADHGRDLDVQLHENCPEPDTCTECSAHPVFADTCDLDMIEYCSHGHSFCGNCGSDLDHEDINGHLGRCGNCGTESVFVDGHGFDYCGSGIAAWEDVRETHKVQVYGISAYCQTGSDGYTTVDAVVDVSGLDLTKLHAYIAWLGHDPSAGTVLILAESFEDASGEVDTHFEDALDVSLAADEDEAEGMRSDHRMDTVVAEVRTDQIWFTTK